MKIEFSTTQNNKVDEALRKLKLAQEALNRRK
jgi:hypothetical protein